MKHCLVVDDSRVVRKIAMRIVRDLGFDCEEAENGRQAFEACQKMMPEAILLNWNMPEMNGLDFLKKLRKMNNGAYPKVIFCTTENDKDQIVLALDNGADEYIMKPFDSEIVEAKFMIAGLIDGD